MEFLTPEDAKKSTSLKIVYTINVIICSINIVFDYYLVKATVKHKSLHKPCLLLIGIYFLCQLLWSASVFIPFAIVILPSAILDSITMQTCAILNFMPVTAFYGISSLAFAIGFDRLLSVYFPLWYSMRLSTKWHILFVTIFSCAMPLYISICIIQNGIKYGDLKTLCTIGDLLRDQLSLQGHWQMVTNSGTVILYLAIFAKFIMKKLFKNFQQNNGGVSPVDLQVLKAVELILGLQIFIWIVGTTFFTIVFSFLSINSFGKTPLPIIHGCIFFTIYALEVPILCFTSSLYRDALQTELNWLLQMFCKNNQVQTLIIVKPAPQIHM